MKNISFFTGLVILFVFGATTYFSSCVHDACVARNVTCENNGTCRDGDCICPSGYEGDSCQFRVNEKFDGFYKCIRTGFINDTIPDDNDDTLHIKANNDKFGITFFSVRDSIINVYKGTVNDNFITVPEQTIGNVTLSGSGSLNGKVVTITINSNWPIGNKSKITYAGTRYEK
ncbi:MAG: calcium-binding EGF-like domain-containing protein [Bacteroidetes bacterium]|jgi:hypothetical protein|nr:calcium-binding EGF-like domain-containing protein [Bacteroidota bacterium]HQW46666.1 hypothetical protein [Chitinophagaceae bacterium]MBK7587764.1 calcium-binding EGF-like domain-containing protein [Bacteroidota bacterium]MBK8328841.1 calcium-binding EGF-like domain-containing protein [Bacteroidota bacterium]MBK9302163.1 calcium-binding EGF-like domain-containing protein [Bacteroidota bacterium]